MLNLRKSPAMAFVAGASVVLLMAATTQIDWVTQIKNKPFYDVRDYNWTAQKPGGSLTGSQSSTIAMSPCPPGVTAASASNYWVLLTLPTEPMLVTGGTCTSGATSGTLVGTPTSSHSGAWTIGPAGGGIFEALQAVSSGGVVQLQPNTTYSIYAHPVVPSNVTISGSGVSTVIQVAAHQWPGSSNSAWNGFGTNVSTSPCALINQNNASNVKFEDFTFDFNGSNQTFQSNFGSDICLDNSTNGVISGVRFINDLHIGQAIAVVDGGTGNVVEHNIIVGPGTAVSTCAGGIFYQVPKTAVSNNYLSGLCDEGIVQNTTGIDSLAIGNIVIGNANAPTVGSLYHCENTSKCSMIANIARGSASAGFRVVPVGSDAASGSDFSISDNSVSCDGANCPTYGIYLQGGSYTITGFSVSANSVDGATAAGVLVLDGCSKGTVSGNKISNSVIGIQVDHSVTSLTAIGNSLYSNATANISPSGGLIPITANVQLSPNATDDAASIMQLDTKVGAAVASTGSITPTGQIFHVTGAATISSINGMVSLPPLRGSCFFMISDGGFIFDTAGNIGNSGTTTAGNLYTACFDGTKFWISGKGL